jgi:hypothetical protein
MNDDMEPSAPPTTSKPELNKRLWLAALLVAVMLTSVGVVAIFIFDLAHNPEHPTPAGGFVGIPQSQEDGFKLTFGTFSIETEFADCKVVLLINGIAQTIQAISLAGGNAFAENDITWVDFTDNGNIDAGDGLVVSNPISTLTYTVTILWANTGVSICSQSWTVP